MTDFNHTYHKVKEIKTELGGILETGHTDSDTLRRLAKMTSEVYADFREGAKYLEEIKK